ncbi:DUF5926 family protein [Corynebacterium pseudopelargi]|uniref:DUF5926 domain-containing protein n=1 Tax=Corynebacterium pseudopelargi TaxID=2080757 RepID=A0A3G6IW45_9CORY|nr:DUF5926 family protein [Corynebacterium pseudopelargi]AZA08300.1 hypothetical protein CPPEL_00760 [Corynebacterium pseudopelargi]
MAKKKKQKEQLPEGMSRRQAKLAARAAERAKYEKDPRPYEGFSFETDLVALQEFVPSAIAKAQAKGKEVNLCTVLPGGGAALVREDGSIFVALQTQQRSQNPHRDLAFALSWALEAKPGSVLEVGVADGSQPKLEELLEQDQELQIEEFHDFNWWVPDPSMITPEYAQGLQMANESVLPSQRVEAPATAWWINPGEKAHIRWVRPEAEDALMKALARVAARDELHLGEGSKFAGVFRTHGVLVPVWDLDPERAPESYAEDLKALDAKLAQELENDAPLNAEERRRVETINSRQVTIR